MSDKKHEHGKSRPRLDLDGVYLPERMRPLQLVHGAFLASCVGVLVMTFLARPASQTAAGGLAVTEFLSVSGIALWLGGYVFGLWWFRRRMRGSRLHEVAHAPFRGPRILAEGATIADKIAHHLRNAWTVRLLAWGIGPVVSLLSVQVAIQGGLVRNDVSFVTTGVFPMIVFLAIGALTFPTVDRVKSILKGALREKE